MRKCFLLLVFIGCAYSLTINSCSKKPATGIDRKLYNMAKDTSGFTWYKLSDTLLPKSENSAHAFSLIRTRFNSLAASRLNVFGTVINGVTFPDGALIVKEMCDKEGKTRVYTMLYKEEGNEYADEKGWLWNAVSAEGNTEISAIKKGKDCIDCHHQEGNIENILMNKYFP
ncbi:MAG: cytochrome P460 family protein [Bacteroidota bacterium]